jgi:hypothetical protein
MSRSKSRTSTPSTTTKSARKAPPKPATKEEGTIDFARNISSRARTRLGAIQKHPTGKKQLPKSRLDEFDEEIREATTAMTAHQLQKSGSAAATTTEENLRVALIVLVREVRDSVGALEKVGKDAAHAYGVGKRLSPKTNVDVLLLSSEQQQAFESEEFAPTAHEAGITEGQISKLVTARRALSNAATTQSNALTAKVGQGIDKKAMLRALAKETTAIRRIARIALRGNAAALKAFAPAPKTRTAKRTAKKVAAPTTGSTATTSSAAKQAATGATTSSSTTGQTSN